MDMEEPDKGAQVSLIVVINICSGANAQSRFKKTNIIFISIHKV